MLSPKGSRIAPRQFPSRCASTSWAKQEDFRSWWRSPSKITPSKFPNRCASASCAKKILGVVMLKLAFGVRGALHENFPNDARRTFVQRIFRKLARKAIEDRSSKISQTMRVENCSKNISEVGEEVHRRSLHENFPNDARRKLIKEYAFRKLAKKSIEDRSTKISQTMCVKKLLKEDFKFNWDH